MMKDATGRRWLTIVIEVPRGRGAGSRKFTISAVADEGERPKIAPNPFQHQPKRRGEEGESFLLWRAYGLGFNVCRPWGDSASFDFILEWQGKMFRVQVKSGWKMEEGRDRYMVSTTIAEPGRRVTYTKRHTDFLACVIPPLNLTYLVPVETLEANQKYLQVVPTPKAGRKKRRRTERSYERYREGWNLLQ